MADHRCVSVERVVPADPQAIFDVLADPAMHPVIDGSGTVKAPKGQAERLKLGAHFGMDMKMFGLPYPIKNVVVEFDEGRRIAWRHWGRHVWRYELEPVDGGTKVTESFDYAPALAAWLYERLGFPEKNREGMTKTLDRLAEVMAERSSGSGTPSPEPAATSD